MSKYEIEQKYRIKNPAEIRRKLQFLKAKRISCGIEHDRLYDWNGLLQSRKSILRLRRDSRGKGLLTFKGPRLKAKYKKRIEVQTPVDYSGMLKILATLGFRVVVSYKKRREEYKLGSSHITLDFLQGIGWFVEIESSPKEIQRIALRLGFSDTDREEKSYVQLYFDPIKIS